MGKRGVQRPQGKRPEYGLPGRVGRGVTGLATLVEHTWHVLTCVQGPQLVNLPPTGSLPILSALAAAHPLHTHRPPGQESGATLVLASGGGAWHGHSWLASPVLVACPHGVDCSRPVASCDRLAFRAIVCVLWQA